MRYLVFSERYQDGQVLSRLEYLREILRARRCREAITCIQITEETWHAMHAVVESSKPA